MKRFLVLLLLGLLLSGCERYATSSNWSPIEAAEQQASKTALPDSLEATATPTKALQSAPTLAQTEAGGGEIAPLDLSTLPEKLPSSMKGYELYSWQTGEYWNFTLITGTNRTKSFDEIIAAGNSVSSDGFVKISVRGIDDLEKVLKLLPTGEQIVWGGMDLGSQVSAGTVYLTFPPQKIMDEVGTVCSGLGLTLTSLKEQ
jgi:hypothetical protein